MFWALPLVVRDDTIIDYPWLYLSRHDSDWSEGVSLTRTGDYMVKLSCEPKCSGVWLSIIFALILYFFLQ